MFKQLKYEDIVKNMIEDDYIFIDVRSPKEFEAETIPGAINIPIFDNEERELIGTVYKQESISKAKKIGIKVASAKIPQIYEKVLELDEKYKSLIFFCARGGFRSSSLVPLFRTLGIDAVKLDEGYKGYRKYINKSLPKIVEDIKFVVLYGNTGTGKTDILKSLENKGIDVLDLEGCANHRGSILGSVGLGKQNTQKMFESLVYESLKSRKTNLVFVEGESKRIGKDIIPEYLFNAMKQGINLKIKASMETRINNILKDYVHGTDDELIEALNYLRKYLGDKNIDRYIQLINDHNYSPVIEELMTKYYDPLYEHNTRKYLHVFYSEKSDKTAENIIEWTNKNIPKP